jgi:hypothetical protein
MIKNYLKIAWRHLWRNNFFSIINIFGLALGVTLCALILFGVQNDWELTISVKAVLIDPVNSLKSE